MKYPSTGTYGGIRGNGDPFNGPNRDDILRNFYQHPYLIQSPTPLTDYLPGLMTELIKGAKSVGVQQKRVAYVTAFMWEINPPWDRKAYYHDLYASIMQVQGFVPETYWFDVSREDVVEILFKVWDKWVLSNSMYHEMFIDGLALNPPPDINVDRVKWKKGWIYLAQLLRMNSRKGFKLTGNYGPAPIELAGIFDRWMYENWDHQSGGFDGIKSVYDSGLWPEGMYMFTGALHQTGEFLTPANLMKYNYGMACAALFGYTHIMEYSDPLIKGWETWKLPEWSLGKPIGTPYRDGNLWRRDCMYGAALVDPIKKYGYQITCKHVR